MSASAGMAGTGWSLAGLRDRLLSSPKFRSWAAAFPLVRPIARRRARALFDLCAGFVYSQILAACVELGLFDILAEGPASAAMLARRMALPEPAAERLLAAAVALRLVSCRGAGFGLGPLGAAMVGNPGLSAMIAHHAVLYRDLVDPVALLRAERGGTELSQYWAYGGRDNEVAPYTALMAASQPMIAEEVLAAYPLARHCRLLDLGGGDGRFAMAAARSAPDLAVTVFDMPAVAERAAERFAQEGLGARATAVGGDFLADTLPGGADIVSLIRVVHDHDDAPALSILRAAHAALPPGGTLLLAEPMSGTPGAEASGDAYFGVYLFAMGRGRPRSPTEFQMLLAQAGFTRSQLLRTRIPMLTRVMVARRGEVSGQL